MCTGTRREAKELPIERNGSLWQPGALVYIQWKEGGPPAKRVVIRLGKVHKRVFVVTYRLEAPQCKKDEVVMACAIGQVVNFFCFFFVCTSTKQKKKSTNKKSKEILSKIYNIT